MNNYRELYYVLLQPHVQRTTIALLQRRVREASYALVWVSSSSMPWKDLAGYRDKMIHQYLGVDLSIAWRSLVVDVPMLLDELLKIQMSERQA